MMTARTREAKGGRRSVVNLNRPFDSHPGRHLADLALQLGLGSLSKWSGWSRLARARHPGVDRKAVTSVYSQIGRVVTATVIATAGAGLALGWLLRRRPKPVPV